MTATGRLRRARLGKHRGAENVRTVAAKPLTVWENWRWKRAFQGVERGGGYGATAGDALVRHHDVRAVSFTGGTATGRNIMKNAGLKKYSMELGRQIAGVDFEDADIERAFLDAALFTISSINGERCTRPAHLHSAEHLPWNLEILPNARTACASAILPTRIPADWRAGSASST